jgi:hypothetical protein
MVQVVNLPSALMAQVQQINEGGLVGGRDGMIVDGQLVLIAVIPIPVPRGRQVQGVVVVQVPPQDSPPS